VPEPLPSRAVIRFDDYVLDLRSGELHKSGRKIKLQEQPFQILSILLQHPGDVVTREDLRRRLWPENTFVDFDHSLNTAIKKLRHALNDEAAKPRFIETLPRRGYRFVGSITPDQPPSQALPRCSHAPAEDLLGAVLQLFDDANKDFLCLPIDEPTRKEKEKLEAADDNLGLSLLCASEKLLLVRVGTRVKVLEGSSSNSYYEVRILEGEHTAKTAVVLRRCLRERSTT
jgi:DNA-binding winged helix-turn-helix (wHTH) protein